MLFQVQFLGPARHETLVPILTMLIEPVNPMVLTIWPSDFMVLAILDTLNHEFDLFIGDLYRFMQIWTIYIGYIDQSSVTI